MPSSLIALGANLGDRERTLNAAIERLGALEQTASLNRGAWHETAPVGGPPNQGPFLNAAVRLETTASAERLHLALRQIELALGRRRVERWEARAIDLDLLLYADQVIETPQLVVPHPRMAFRRFVLEAAVEVAPEMIHPTIGWTIARLLEHLDSAAEYVAMLGMPGSGKTALAASLGPSFQGRALLHESVPTAAKKPESWLPQAADPSGHPFARQIQFLERFTNLLDKTKWPRPEQLAVSDFCLNQCLAYARVELDQAQQAAFTEAWQVAGQRAVSPKLLIVLDAPPPDRLPQPEPPPTASDGDLPPAEQLRQEMLRLASRKGLGPVLFTGGIDQRTQYEEISAAITSMK